jgi:hypothetical protein
MAENRSLLKYLEIISKSEKNKTFSLGIFTLIILIVLIVGAIQPTATTIFRINNELREKRRVNTQLEDKLAALATLNREYVDMESDINDLPLIFPTQGNFSLFMSNIEEICKTYGYNLQSINFNTSDDVDLNLNTLDTWNAAISIKGKRSNLVRLLEEFESMPMYPVVTQVSYSNTVDDQGLTNFSIALTIFHIEDSNFFK